VRTKNGIKYVTYERDENKNPFKNIYCIYKKLLSLKYNIPVIQDSAHALGAEFMGFPITDWSEYSMFSFQAIKHITTGDGGMLVIKDKQKAEKAKRIRWFGIDRKAKQTGVWENDITEVGYKYQMTDIAATMGIEGLKTFEDVRYHRKILLLKYWHELSKIPGIKVIGDQYKDRTHAAWLCTILVENRKGLQDKLREKGIESGKVHYRNDRYTIFKNFKGKFPNMDAVDENYLVLPLHTKMWIPEAERVCSVIKSGW
jgi:dTDP-4-amino-4,6-dideoxygalactose transaminase